MQGFGAYGNTKSNWDNINSKVSKKVYIIDHCPAIREIAGLSAERTGRRIGSKG